MEQWTVSTPVVLFIYNRPATTRAVFQQIAAVEPDDLYVVADGPAEDATRGDVEAAREVIEVDWDCTVHRNFADENMGLRERFSSGLEWVFEDVDQAIILEDDVLPNCYFFRFCQEMLEEYASDDRVMEVTGYNPLEQWKSAHQQYHFSLLGGIWGWATWADSWSSYDPEMSLWADEEIKDRVRDSLCHGGLYLRKKRFFEKVYSGGLNTWDYQWQFTRFVNSGLSVVPARNLVRNIGFGSEATNTASLSDPRADLNRHEISFPIERRPDVVVDRDYETQFFEEVLQGRFERYLPPSVYAQLLRYRSKLKGF